MAFAYCIPLMHFICSSIICVSCKAMIASQGQYLFKCNKQQTKMFSTSLGDKVTISHLAILYFFILFKLFFKLNLWG